MTIPTPHVMSVKPVVEDSCANATMTALPTCPITGIVQYCLARFQLRGFGTGKNHVNRVGTAAGDILLTSYGFELPLPRHRPFLDRSGHIGNGELLILRTGVPIGKGNRLLANIRKISSSRLRREYLGAGHRI